MIALLWILVISVFAFFVGAIVQLVLDNRHALELERHRREVQDIVDAALLEARVQTVFGDVREEEVMQCVEDTLVVASACGAHLRFVEAMRARPRPRLAIARESLPNDILIQEAYRRLVKTGTFDFEFAPKHPYFVTIMRRHFTPGDVQHLAFARLRRARDKAIQRTTRIRLR